jgi:hypothetical protein
MSEREDFLARWSRRKRQSIEEVAADVEDAAAAAPSAPERTADSGKAPDKEAPLPEPTEPLFDPAALPSIESITAATDIRAFLAPGVPTELTRAALRRAWAADAKIRDFVGLADYAWDFHASDAMAGFGPLEMTDELRREIVGMLTRGQPEDAPADNPGPQEKNEQTPRGLGLDQPAEPGDGLRQEAVGDDQDKTADHNNLMPRTQENIPPQNHSAKQPASIVQRVHGRALPKP